MNRKNGLTLTELLVVIALLGALITGAFFEGRVNGRTGGIREMQVAAVDFGVAQWAVQDPEGTVCFQWNKSEVFNIALSPEPAGLKPGDVRNMDTSGFRLGELIYIEDWGTVSANEPPHRDDVPLGMVTRKGTNGTVVVMF